MILTFQKKIFFLTALICLFFCTQAFPMERFDIVTTRELKTMLDEREAGRLNFLLVNGLDRIIYREASIPGSINIPWSKMDPYASLLGNDRNRLIITY